LKISVDTIYIYIYTSSIAPRGGKPADGATMSSATRRYSFDIFPFRSLGKVSRAEFKVCNICVQYKEVEEEKRENTNRRYITKSLDLVQFKLVG